MDNSSIYYGENGIHRVPLWRIAGFALNNTATNLYLILMNYVSYYLMGLVGVGMVTASSFAMMMRLWDGVTDPFIGFVVDKTNGKFGKNRPFMVIGNVILFITSFIMLHTTHKLSDNTIVKFIFFIVFAAFYYIGYTFQCVVTKSAQTCLTNDPKQRPLFASFDGIFNTLMIVAVGILVPVISKKFDVADAAGNVIADGYSQAGFFHTIWMITAFTSALCTCIAIYSIAPKDHAEFFGTGKRVRITMKDFWSTLKGNRAVQMLVLASSTDKLAASAKTSAVTIAMFACLAGSKMLQSRITLFTAVPSALVAFLAITLLATKLGQKKAMLLGSWGGIVVNLLLGCLWLFGNPTSMTSNAAAGTINWGFFTIAFVVGSVLQAGCQGLYGNIIIPMTADCADYEVYRTGKYIPGLMGALFSFTEKLVTSLSPMITGLVFAACGFASHNPVQGDTVTTALKIGVVFLAYGIVILGLICNIAALKLYPLSKEKMAEIQSEVAAIKEQNGFGR